jgi:hypothetical protein
MTPSTPPYELLKAALAGIPSLSRLEMHAFLHGLCSSHVITLQNCMREPMWERWAATLQNELALFCQEADWTAHLAVRLSQLGEVGPEKALVFAAALLRSLDARHDRRARNIHSAIVPLPPELGGGSFQFVRPPETPLANLVPQGRQLQRGRGDLKSDLRDVLDLSWYLIPLERHVVKPRFNVLEALTSRELSRRLAEQGGIRIGLAVPFADLHYVIRSDSSRSGKRGTPYRFAEIAPECLDTARTTLDEILEACAENQIDVLCFPELTLDASLLQHLRLRLQLHNPTRHPLLVVSGSFHSDAEGGGWINRCRLLGGSGALLSTQDKCTAYSLPGSQVTAVVAKLLGVDQRGGYEDIHQSAVLEMIDSPLGRLATPICLDFCGEQIRDLAVDSCVNLFLVPAMSPRMEPFQESARDFGTQNRAATFVVNSLWMLRQAGSITPEMQSLIFAYLPARRLEPAVRKLSEALYLCTIGELSGAA